MKDSHLYSVLILAVITAMPSCVVPLATPDRVSSEFEKLSVHQKVQVLPALRKTIEQELGLVSGPPRVAEAGHNRIMNRGRFEGMTVGRGGGAYFSFETGLNDYNQGPDLELQNWSYSSGFYGGNFGIVAKLDVSDFDSITMSDIPAGLITEQADKNQERVYGRPASLVGAIYAIRAWRLGESDLLAIFQVTDQDEYGAGFDWKVMKVFPKPMR